MLDPLRKMILLLLWGGFLLLIGDLRIEHNDVLHETWHAWIPLVFSAAMLILIPIGLATWRRAGRVLLLTCFVLSGVVGIAGIAFHMKEKPAGAVQHVLKVWTSNPGVGADRDQVVGSLSNSMSAPAGAPAGPPRKREKWPPLLAPLAFAGLGLIGLASCWKFAGTSSHGLRQTRELQTTVQQ